MTELRVCLNCGELLHGAGHFAPPSLGEPGFFTCKKPEPSPPPPPKKICDKLMQKYKGCDYPGLACSECPVMCRH